MYACTCVRLARRVDWPAGAFLSQLDEVIEALQIPCCRAPPISHQSRRPSGRRFDDPQLPDNFTEECNSSY